MSNSQSTAGFTLVRDGHVAALVTSPDDFDVVGSARRCFAEDVERVTGIRPDCVEYRQPLSGPAVLIGTLGHSALIDDLIARGKLDVSGLAGLWESFLIRVVAQPLPGVEVGLVVAGSDRRGTAYGVFALSEQIGVSPWVWWADVTPVKRDRLIIRDDTAIVGPPAVKYRGIFINDEDWSLREWASTTFAPEEAVGQKGFGPKTYARVFELLLRLRANLLWPAMHPGTRAFNDTPENAALADRYAIVMGSSHCEPLLRNNVGEWDAQRHGEWNYATNAQTMLDYWAERLRENGRYENVYTLGMRGIHDDPMPGLESLTRRVARLSDALDAQRDLLRRYVADDVEAIPQILCVYKEVLDLYKAGLEPPPDVTLVWSDDNYGYLTNLPSLPEVERGRKFGIYYHISYWGRPHDYLWLNTTPPALIWSEMHKAYEYGARELWVVNVGGLKAHEIGMEYFLRLAWNADRWDADSPRRFLIDWAGRDFGLSEPDTLADLLTEFFRLGFIRKPEHMGWNTTYPETQNRPSEWSAVSYGDEIARRLSEYDALVAGIDRIYESLPPEKQDAFYQLVVYPARCSALMSQKFLHAQKSQVYAAQGRVTAADYAAKARQAFADIEAETERYNRIGGGKWRNVMDCAPRRLPVFALPPLAGQHVRLAAGYGLVVETNELPNPLAGQFGYNQRMPAFSRLTVERHFFDLYRSGDEPVRWSVRSAPTWLLLSARNGLIDGEQRVWVEVDWARLPDAEHLNGEIALDVSGATEVIGIEVFNLAVPDSDGAFESNGCIAFDAARYAQAQTADGVEVAVVPGLGRTGRALDVHVAFAATGTVPREGCFARLDYRVYVTTPGSALVDLYCLPAHPIHPGRGLRCRLAFDDQPPQEVDLTANGGEFDRVWQENVLRGAAVGRTRHRLETMGWHTLTVRVLDAGLILDRIIVDLGGLRPSYLGPVRPT